MACGCRVGVVVKVEGDLMTHEAAREGRGPTLRLLNEYGADWRRINKVGGTVMV